MSTTLTTRLIALRKVLARIERDFSPAAFASSFGAEDMVLHDLIAKEFAGIAIFTLDTGRLPAETLTLMDQAHARYGVEVKRYSPEVEGVQGYIAHYGVNGFYESIDARKACCGVRKVAPLARALAGKRAWLTGLRREQAASRATLAPQETDHAHGIEKFNPLIEWPLDDVWAYLRANKVPYNALHDRGYPSIGCEPCTRAVKAGEDIRAGRWWWENKDGQKECGLHIDAAPASSIPQYAAIQINVVEKAIV
jgi:phosphoadenosine phosphosulfate reductase